MKQRRNVAIRAMVIAVSAAAVMAVIPSEHAFAQAAPEGTEYDYSGIGGGFMDELVSKARVGTMLRGSYFSRTKPNRNGPTAEAGAVGGWLWGETGEWRETLSFGGAIAYVAELHGPEGHGSNFILKDPNQEGYATLGVAYAKLRAGDHNLYAGRVSPTYAWSLEGVYRFYNRFDGAFIGRRDVRAMIPLAYEGGTVNGKLMNDTLRYYGGYVTSMKQINDTDFKNLSSAALVPGDSDGMAFGGAQWKINKNMMLQGGYHQADNLLNTAWGDFDTVYRFDKDRYIRLDVQYLWQEGNGDKNLGDFTMNNKAAYIEARPVAWFVPYGIVGRNSHGDELRSPFSLGPSYLVQRIGENAKAGERTWILGTTLDFATLGVRGLAFDVNYGERTDRHVKGNEAQPLADWKELSTDLIYTFGKEWGWADGIRVRARWARVWEEGDQFSGGRIASVSQHHTDIRFDLQWAIRFK